MTDLPSTSTSDVRRDQVRARLVEIARLIVLESGVDSLSMREVARRAGYAPGALYTYFDGKDGLVAALGFDATNALAGYLRSVDGSVPARPRLEMLAARYIDFATEQPQRYASVFSGLRVPTTSWDEFVAVGEPFTLIVEAFADGVTERAFVAGDGRSPDAMAFGLWALLHGAATLRAGFLGSMGDQLAEPTRMTVAAYLDGLSVPAHDLTTKGASR